MNSRTYRLGAFLVLSVAPWTVLVGSGGVQLVFLWGLANPTTGHAVSLPDYLFVLTSGLPDRLLAWPASTILFLAAMLSVLWNEVGRGDVRVTAGLLALSAFSHLGFVVGAATRGTATAIPLGPALAGLVVWWFYWPVLRGIHSRER